MTIDGSGTLNAYGGHGSAGIGSSFTETAGTMIFNNGVINAHAWRYDTSDGAAPADSWLIKRDLCGTAPLIHCQ